MNTIGTLCTRILRGKGSLIEVVEILLTALVFSGVVYFGISSISRFVDMDWSNSATLYSFITTILLILLGFEVARLILVHSITVVMELMLLIVARKMLYPDIHPADLVYCAIAFAIIVGVYYVYELKPLKSLDDLTQ